jgi:tetratricopeptide (TPR) repeat protein
MRISRTICLAAFLAAIGLGVPIAWTQIAPEDKSLGDIARELRTRKPVVTKPEPSTSSPPARQTPDGIVSEPSEIARLTDEVRRLVLREQFAALDEMADALRSSKARVPGGGWKLSRFYDAVNRIPSGIESTDRDWQRQFAFFQRWISARPKSITARVALADAYISYAWEARGDGYANTVTQQGWRVFGERMQQAQKALLAGAELPSKCPRWYEVMQQVALAAGADKNQLRAVFEKAIEFEPDYFAYYQQYARALLPKWTGAPGDTEEFADESYRRVGGKKGAHIYFEIASNLCNRCGDFSSGGYSWGRIQEGFAAMEELYGVLPLKLNRFAMLAATYGDKEAAAKAFQRIGPNWDRSVWGTRGRFESQKSWAGLPAASQPSGSGVKGPAQPDYRISEMLLLATKAGNEGRWKDSAELAQQAIDTAKPLPGTAFQLKTAYLLLATNERRQGHMLQAQEMVDKAVSVISEKEGANSLEVANALHEFATFEQLPNNDRRLEAHLRRAIEIREKAKDGPSLRMANEFRMLALVCQRGGRNQEAAELLQRAIKTYDAVRPDHWVMSMALGQLGAIYQEMGRYQDAEAAFLRMLYVSEGGSGLNSAQVITPLAQLASLYRAMGKPTEAERMLQRIQSISRGENRN